MTKQTPPDFEEMAAELWEKIDSCQFHEDEQNIIEEALQQVHDEAQKNLDWAEHANEQAGTFLDAIWENLNDAGIEGMCALEKSQNVVKKIAVLQAQNQKMREALEEAANERNWIFAYDSSGKMDNQKYQWNGPCHDHPTDYFTDVLQEYPADAPTPDPLPVFRLAELAVIFHATSYKDENGEIVFLARNGWNLWEAVEALTPEERELILKHGAPQAPRGEE